MTAANTENTVWSFTEIYEMEGDMQKKNSRNLYMDSHKTLAEYY